MIQMVEIAKKYCTTCEHWYAATAEFFYPSHLHPKGKKKKGYNTCRVCHREAEKKRDRERKDGIRPALKLEHKLLVEKMKGMAQFYEAESLPPHRSLHIIAKDIKRSKEWVECDVYNRHLPLIKFKDSRGRVVLGLKEEDVTVYVESIPIEIDRKKAVQVSFAPGTPDQCGACGTDKGNILGDVDSKSHEKYGYLCARCHKLVRDFHGDVHRMQKVLAYIEQTRSLMYTEE